MRPDALRMGRAVWLACALLLLCTRPTRAQSGRPTAQLGGDLIVGGRPTEGLIVLHSGYRNSPYIDADAVVWMGAGVDDTRGDVLTVSLGFREPHGLGRARVGRFVLSTGAVRPVHIDGASVLGRAPSGTSLEAFAGMPVVPELGPRAFDWLAGARLGQTLLSEDVSMGMSYLHRRDAGQLATEELGADLSLRPLRWATINALGSWDLIGSGLAETRLSASAHTHDAQLELFAARRIAARLIPATSLFSVISDTPTSELGTAVTYTLFPRLDVGGTFAFEALGGTLGYRVAPRTTLRFSDARAGGDVSLEVTRRELRDEGYSGVLVDTAWPVTLQLRTHASVELVAADEPRDRGKLWPWTRVGASYALTESWSMAAAVGGKASPAYSSELYALVRLSYQQRSVVP